MADRGLELTRRLLARPIWVDAQLPPQLARWLVEEFGELATHVADVGMLEAADVDIFEAARANGIAVAVSKDEDFVRLVEQRHPPPQVVWITCGNVRNAELRRIMIAAWPAVAQQIAAGEPLIEVSRRTPG